MRGMGSDGREKDRLKEQISYFVSVLCFPVVVFVGPHLHKLTIARKTRSRLDLPSLCDDSADMIVELRYVGSC